MKTRSIPLLIGLAALCLSLALPLSAGAADANAPVKMAVVDLKKCLVESKMGKKVKEEFDQKTLKIDQKGQALEKEARGLAADVQKQGALLTDAVKREKQERFLAINDELKKLERQKKELNDELTMTVIGDVQVIVKKLAEERGLDLVLNDGGPWFLYVAKAMDITDEVIRLYDESKPGKAGQK